uniref:Small ribosomal subunit protein bS6m n=1 Tax=Callithrix jacchus TaxID=9483 RepID=A0A8I3WSX1_CALJA
MPRYELALILKAMQRPETAAALKRTIEALMDRGAIVRDLENLGERALPYRISAHNQQYNSGGNFQPEQVTWPYPTSSARDLPVYDGTKRRYGKTRKVSWRIFSKETTAINVTTRLVHELQSYIPRTETMSSGCRYRTLLSVA